MSTDPASPWLRLVWIPPSVDRETAEDGRFFAAVMVITFPLLLLIAVVAVPLWLSPESPTEGVIFRDSVLMTVATVVAYFVNRSGRCRAAALGFCLTSVATLTDSAADTPQLLVFLPLTMLAAVAMLPVRLAVVIGGAAVLAAVPVAFLADDRSSLVLPFLLNVFFFPLLLLVRSHHDRLARLRAEELARRERWFSTTLSSIGDAVLTTDAGERVTFLNPVAQELTGFTSEAAVGRKSSEVFRIVSEHDGTPVPSPVTKVLQQRSVVALANHTELIGAGGVRRPIADSGAPILDAEGQLYGAVLVFRDMTAERALRAQLEHSQRLDALGKLAGSVAHDFNNLLTVIGGGAQLAQNTLSPEHRAHGELAMVLDAAERAVGVTQQLLAFSRRQVMRLDAIDLNATVQGSVSLIQRLLGPGVAVRTELDPAAQRVLADAVQCQQMLLNLAINAGDAMPQGGTLTLSTRSLTAQDAQADPPIASGDYTCLQVRDTGVGMDAQTLARAFEPFFTTKAQGRGTGLGLATVYGIVEQSQGAIRLRSTPGAGTTFDVFLPATHAEQPAAVPNATPKPPRSAVAARVLVVEDDELVRGLAARLLTLDGYQILQAGSADQALALTAPGSPAIDLLLTDVLMPGMSGVELAEKLRERVPGLAVVFMSGYATELLAKQGLRSEAGSFVAKPFGTEALGKAVREALDARAPQQATRPAE
jgi:two-component system cell cycle sensor histidine kinase/response regulator CckA